MGSNTALDFTIRPVISSADVASVAECFRAYTEWLNLDLTFQDFTTELSTLPGKYASPKGALLLACDSETSEVLGCIGMRPIELQSKYRTRRQSDVRYCELKRLYVYPAARGRKVAKALVEEVLRIARQNGYQEALLDTMESMTAAISLYRTLGFEETEPYYDNPGEGFLNMFKRIQA